MKTYTSFSFVSDIDFDITPSSGIPYYTHFEFKTNKKNSNLKCEFGYRNDIGLVVLPTSDTSDELNQSV